MGEKGSVMDAIFQSVGGGAAEANAFKSIFPGGSGLKILTMISDVPPTSIIPIARALLLSDMMKSLRLRQFIYYILQLRISQDRKGRGEAVELTAALRPLEDF